MLKPPEAGTGTTLRATRRSGAEGVPMKRPTRSFIARVMASAILLSPAAFADELVELMGALQTHTHKLQLSLDHGNQPLAAFYVHEVEELVEAVGEVDEYDGYPVGQLATSMLTPVIGRLESALENGNLEAANRELDALVNACNACHVATNHAFIVIARNSANPYLQSFEP
jgi:hypothetical protein